MPFFAYVHARQPGEPEGEGRAPWEPNWRIWRWIVAAVVVTYAAARADGTLELLLVFAVFALCCRAALDAMPDGDGLRQWRQ
ncbi:MAG: hypothetical protein QOI45_252 [Thermoleophilaceae bacterium]|nr:hypothetical protein [Thermoleophilaceae bacterium]MEA2453990.1 hypothetical protein [Thermoleophilaceae bacterium]